MKRSRHNHEESTISQSGMSTKKQQHHIMSEVVKEEIVDQTQSNQSSSSSSQVNHQVTIKKEEPSDECDTKPKLIKCEFKKEDCKSESHQFEIKRECIKNEPDKDCGCDECNQEQNNICNQQDIHFQTNDDRSTDDAQLEHHDDGNRCPTPDYLPSFFDSTDDSDEDSDEDSEEANCTHPRSPHSANPTLNDQNVEDSSQNQEATSSSTNHYVRRSNRTTATPINSYASQYIESSDSEESDATEISNSEKDNDDDGDDGDEEEEIKSQSESDNNDVDYLSRQQVILATQKTKTKLINPRNKKARIQTESSDEETEVEGENDEQEPSRGIKIRNPKRWITIVHLKCSVCGQKVKDEFELKLHQLTEHQIRRFQCPVGDCSASFEYCEQVPEHKLTEHGDLSVWPCRECSFEANSYKRLLHHRWDSHQEGHFKCGHDGCQFDSHTTRMALLNHLGDAHLSTFFCSFCNKSFKQKCHLKVHVRTVHTGERPFVCTNCPKSFATQKDLNGHVRKVHEAYKPYGCKWPDCTFTSGYAANIVRHVRVHHLSTLAQQNRNPKEFVEKRFQQFRHQSKNSKDKDKVAEESKDEEKAQIKYITLRLDCPVEKCSVFVANKIELNQHLLQCHQIDQHRCLLSDCTASFKYLKQLTVHLRNDHKNMNRFECAKCGKYSSSNYKKLIVHNYFYHEIGHFPCPRDGCDFVSTTNRQKVAGHQYTHLEAKYKCSEEGCTYAAKDKRCLVTHLKRHRQSNEPKVTNRYDCSKCCRFFPRQTDIVRHEKSHLKDGYRCQWKGCDYFASDTYRIKLHLCNDHKLKKPASNQWDNRLRKYWKRVIVN